MSRVLIAVLLLCACASAQSVILIIADDLGVESIGAYGHGPANAVTKNIDLMAHFGTTVDNAWSAPVCSPTRAMMMTGRYPFETDIGGIFKPAGMQFMKNSEVTIPEVATGHRSAAFGKWHLADVHPIFSTLPISQGFERFEGTLTSFPTISTPGGGAYFDYFEIVATPSGATSQHVTQYATSETTDDAIAWLSGLAPGEPYFLWLAYHAPHPPYHRPPTNLHDVRLPPVAPGDKPGPFYRAATEALDTEIGRLLMSLRAPGVPLIDLSDTLIIFVGDNGTPSPALEGAVVPGKAKGTLFEGGIHVPMIVAGAGVPRRERMGGLVSLMDVFPTALDHMGYAHPTDSAVSLYSELLSASPSPRQSVFMEVFKGNLNSPVHSQQETARGQRYKLTRRNLPAAEVEVAFYDLLADPLEESPLDLMALTARQQEAYNHLLSELDTLGEE